MINRKLRLVNRGLAGILLFSVVLLLYIADLLPVSPKLENEKNEDNVLPSIQKLHSLTHQELAMLYHRYINTVQALCKRVVRIGNLGDGGWELCEDIEFRPKHPCLVYSFGINNDFSFDDMMADRFKCDVYSFDPSMKETLEGPRGPRQWFFRSGLSERTETFQNEWQVSTLKDLQEKHGHGKDKIDILKIDVEKFEWLALTQIYESGGLKNIRQLLIELHMGMRGVEAEKLEYIQGLGILKHLYDNGFRIVYSHRNIWCKFLSKLQHIDEVGCHELTFVYIP
ncbi:probable methyltransferase-like protein 24 isoform X1 [Dreissena polymorpha]|uniref:Methyltransferase domain-containing protein n=2 Tax=Dreissena polymorpha TaxID=45954 RepID=A0A9D4E9L7_DREPO|nr:probable methyltransferase-like protein 24 isoform X1 [Dreissena polymorpha]KAH3775658.1 hypothetical protein DPMN_177064 [Dreissena polymorpha]